LRQFRRSGVGRQRGRFTAEDAEKKERRRGRATGRWTTQPCS